MLSVYSEYYRYYTHVTHTNTYYFIIVSAITIYEHIIVFEMVKKNSGNFLPEREGRRKKISPTAPKTQSRHWTLLRHGLAHKI